MKNQNQNRVMEDAITRLAAVNTANPHPWDEAKSDEEWVCRVLCDYLRIEARVPTSDIAGSFGTPTEEILYLSGIRHKTVALPQNWYKHAGSPMLGKLRDGTPIALLPGKIFGYRACNPRTGKQYKVTAEAAKEIEPQAEAVFRTFPDKKIGLREISGFILGENIYKEICLIIALSFLASVVQMIPPLVAEQIFDIVVPQNLRGFMVEIVFILIALEFANAGFYVMVNLGVARIKSKSGLAVQAALWDRLLNLSLPFFNQYTTGELIQKIKGTERIKRLISLENLQIIFGNIFAFIYIIVLFNISSVLTPYVLLMFLILFTVHAVAGRTKYRLFKRLTDFENRKLSFTHQCVRGIIRVKASCAEERIFGKWSHLESQMRLVNNKINFVDSATRAFQLFFDLISIAALYMLIIFNYGTDIGVGVFVAFVAAFLVLQKSMRKLLKALGVLPELFAVCSNVKPILDAVPEYSKKIIPKDLKAAIEVNHAYFRFSQYGRGILNDISFRVEEGQNIGIIGVSGGGKTTLLKLLMGLYDLTSGKIYYGGYDLETLDIKYLRRQMGVVMQGSKLTAEDVYSAVTNGDSSNDDVITALKKAGVYEKLSALPEGLHTKLTELSDGDRQRIAIARAIARNYKFIFLDEATHNLDNISRGEIMQELRHIPATQIIIAQHISSVRHCDKIIVIDKGRIAAQGTYEQVTK